MSHITASLVVSGSAPFDTDRVSVIMGMPATKIWKRKAGLKVHGPDTIPLMSWILEYVGNQGCSLEETLATLLTQTCSNANRLVDLANELGLTTSVVCRLVTHDPEQGIALSADVLSRLASLHCEAVFSVEYEAQTEQQPGSDD